MLSEFLKKYEKEILQLATNESLALAGVRPTSDQLKMGLPVFFHQIINILNFEKQKKVQLVATTDNRAREKAATDGNEKAMVLASGYPEDMEIAKSGEIFGAELLKLGYTVSHVVHTYGSLCQAITGLATAKSLHIDASEFRNLNRCLDVALAAAVTEFQKLRDLQKRTNEIERCGFCTHELRNSLSAASISFQMIKNGEVGFSGSVGQILERNLKRMEELVGRSLTEVKLLGSRPRLEIQTVNLFLLVDQLLVTANVEAKARKQILEIHIDPVINLNVDQQFFHSAVSNLIQNAIKYTHVGGKIQIRGAVIGDDVVIEIEDECGGLSEAGDEELFKPFVQQSENRKGLGLGLTLARRAIELHAGTLKAKSLPGTGCIFTIKVPQGFNSLRPTLM